MTESKIDLNSINHYQAPPELLKDKIILVSGAGSGIGKAAALSYAQHGATVILTGRTLSKLEAVYDAIENLDYPQPAIFPINFESAVEKDYQALRDAIEKEFGRLDGLLNNAGTLGKRTPLEQYPIDAWERTMHVNVTAPFMLTKTLLPLLTHDKPSSIIFTGSGVGIKGRAYWGAYAVSKGATENMMQVFADEAEGVSKIRVNSINPGATRTSMRAEAYPAEDPNKLLNAEQIMNSYLFLMGADSESINACQIDAQPK
jgi:NAD(P)-dependent dehydrogenase (short-subunit alcohol dehydrogenase family)